MIDTLSQIRSFVSRQMQPNLHSFLASRQPVIWVIAAGIGIAVAYAIIAFRFSIAMVQYLWLGTFGEKIVTLATHKPFWLIVLAPAAGGLVVGLLLRFVMPSRRAEAVADVIEARALKGARMPLLPGLGAALISAISLGAGASAGREGPAVHLGATLASALGRMARLDGAALRALLGAGVAAAVSASFNAPIAGTLFALEVVLGIYAIRAFIPIVIAAVGATLVTRHHMGDFPAFILPSYQIQSFFEFPAFALLGFVCGLVAISFQLSMIYADWVAERVTCPLWLRPVVGGLMVGLIATMFPQIMGVGYEATDAALHGRYTLGLLLALLLAKTVATAITLASRFGGGIFSPSLYLGAMAGGAFGLIAGAVLPGFASHDGLYAIIGMGAVSAAILGAPISTTLIVFELTGGYAMTIALLLAVSISTGMMQAVMGRSFFHWQLSTRGLVLHEGPHRQIARTLKVADFMEALEDGADAPDMADDAPVLSRQETLETALRTFNESGLSRLAVTSDRHGRDVIGHVTRMAAMDAYNAALINANVEAHR